MSKERGAQERQFIAAVKAENAKLSRENVKLKARVLTQQNQIKALEEELASAPT